MANKTIYGCVDRATSKIMFRDEACDGGDYEGCIVRSGIHAGQVAVTVLEPYCDDIYYGCVNRDTGKFEVIIPDDCCIPLTLCLPLAGITDCYESNPNQECPWPVDVNGEHILYHISGLYYRKTFDKWNLIVNISEGWVRADIGEHADECWYVYGTHTAFIACFIPNTYPPLLSNDIQCSDGECGYVDCNGNEISCGCVIGEGGMAGIYETCPCATANAWNPATTYLVGDYVERGNNCYRCKEQHINQEPPNDTYWALVTAL